MTQSPYGRAKKKEYIFEYRVAVTLTTGASVDGAVSLGADARVGALSVHTLAVAADPRDCPAFVDVCHTNTQKKNTSVLWSPSKEQLNVDAVKRYYCCPCMKSSLFKIS